MSHAVSHNPSQSATDLVRKPMTVVLLDWKPIRKNTLVGFAKVKLGALKISELPVHNNNDKRWVNLPARALMDREGRPMLDDRGKQRYQPIIEWENRESSDRFSEAVLTALEEAHPGATSRE